METSTQDDSVSTMSQPGRTVAGLCIAAVFACATVPMIGWMLRIPVLTTFGLVEPMPPFGCIAFACMAAATLILSRGHSSRRAMPLLAVPIAIGLERLFVQLVLPAGSHGIDGWLFADDVRTAFDRAMTGPGIVADLILVALPVAIGAAAANTRSYGRLAAALAGGSLVTASTALLLIPMLPALHATGWHLSSTSLPSAIGAMLLALAVLAWRSDILDEPGAWSPEWHMLRLVLPLLLVVPVLAPLVEMASIELAGVSAVWGELLTVTLNFVVVSALVTWTVRSAARHRAALSELTEALNAAPMALVDTDDRIIHWSRGCEELYGWRAHEALGRQKHVLLASCTADGSLATGCPHADGERELIERRRDGSAVHVIEQARRVEKLARAPALVLSMTDISTRLEIEAALRKSEERLALASSAHEVGVFEWEVATGALTWTAGSEQRLGLPAGSLHDYPSWAALIDPDDLAEVERTIAETVGKRAPRISFTYRLRLPNGTQRFLEGSARCFYDQAGVMIRTTGITLDITRHEEREAALRVREAQLRSILETVPDAMIVIDEAGAIRSFSAAAELIFGYSAAEAIGLNVQTLIPGEREAWQQGYLRRYPASGDRRGVGHGRLTTARRVDGSSFPVELHVGEALVDGERVLTGFVRDISERIAAEERLSLVRRELMQVIRLNAVGEMAAALAHELNQPLAAIANFVTTAELLLDSGAGMDGDRLKATLISANAQALRAGDIIHRLREFIAKRESEMRIEPVEATLREAVTLLTSGGQHADIELSFGLSPDADFMLADRIQVQQVVVNLLRNAFEALATSPDGARGVLIEARLNKAALVEISICDNGPGLPDAILSRMFTPFTSSKGEGGMGFGLSICRRIVEAHGGELVGFNAPGGGACFRFTVPHVCLE